MQDSIRGKLNSEELKGYLINTLKFTAPSLAVLFFNLSIGAPFLSALSLAMLILYGNLSDLFKKLSQGK